MSLVGPRPPLPYEVEQYKAWHCRRVLEAKPGITGSLAGRRAEAARRSTRWSASTCATPGRRPSGPTSRSFSRRRGRVISREGRLLDSARRSRMRVYVCIAPDVKLGKDVKLAKFVNLYGCEIGDETKLGAFVEIQKNATRRHAAARSRATPSSAKA